MPASVTCLKVAISGELPLIFRILQSLLLGCVRSFPTVSTIFIRPTPVLTQRSIACARPI